MHIIFTYIYIYTHLALVGNWDTFSVRSGDSMMPLPRGQPLIVTGRRLPVDAGCIFGTSAVSKRGRYPLQAWPFKYVPVNAGRAIINHPILMICTTHLY